ncbi:MAG TPA: SpoIIE family protein phosphatase [Pyrinomonadaceae bacterium]
MKPKAPVLCFAALAVACVMLLCVAARTPAAPAFKLTAEDLKDGVAELKETEWAYRFGDDPAWAARDYDDSGWATSGFDAAVRHPEQSPPGERWEGRAWFRLRLDVDEELAGRPLALRMEHWGASEVYVDGVLVKRFGVIEPGRDVELNPRYTPVTFAFKEGGRHSVALRYSHMVTRDPSKGLGRWLTEGNFGPGFDASLYTADGGVARSLRAAASSLGNRFFVGILAALGLLHLLLYVFYRRERGNLFYGIFAFGLAMTQVVNRLYQSGAWGGVETSTAAAVWFVVWCVLFVFVMVSLLAFHYVAFGVRFSKLFRLITALWVASALLSTYYVRQNISLLILSACFVLTLGDAIRIMWGALRRGLDGARIVMTGLLLFTAGVLYQLGSEVFGYRREPLADELSGFAILLAVPISVSVYLARNFARTNSTLETQLAQVQELSSRALEHERREAELRLRHEQERAQNERRARELEEAKQLQLSMLPKSVPRLPGVEVAAYMKTATEVGGDYYDFHVGEDGTLTVVVGDATGHGLRAGTVVTATKSLFNAYASEHSIPLFLGRVSAALKSMNMRSLYMALALVKVSGGRLSLGGAGMPPAFLFRGASGEVEEVALKGAPLGSFPSYAYREREFALAPGDCLLLMSDGLPEMFNERGEMFEGERARDAFAEVAREDAAAVVAHLVGACGAWAGGRPLDDDVTFVVLKMR